MGRRFVWRVGAAMVVAACVTEASGLLFINFTTTPPSVTTDSVVQIAGEVVRTPNRQGILTVVTVTGGAETTIDTTNNFLLFLVDVPLNLGATNRLVVTARDTSGATTASEREFMVAQENPSPLALLEAGQ